MQHPAKQAPPAQQAPKEAARLDRTAVSASSGALLVRLAESEDEIRAAQALRYRVFYEEQGAVPEADTAVTRLDVDRFDDKADHLLVLDTTRTDAQDAVVGTYRLIRRQAVGAGGFYSNGEFDLSRLEVTGSSGFCSGAAAFAGFLKTFLGQTLADYMTPTVNDLIQGFLPDPLGIEGAQYLVAGEGKIDGNQLLNGGLVLDDENGGAHSVRYAW